MHQSNQMVAVSPEKYPVLAMLQDGVNLLDNLGNEGMSMFDFPKLRRNGPTAMEWETGDQNNPEKVKEPQGIVLYTNCRRNLYDGQFGDNPIPICTSLDTKTGVGNPGGECEKCPLGVIGGECKKTRLVMLLREGQYLPEIISIAPTSLASARNWLLKLGGRPYWGFVTRFRMIMSRTKGEKPRDISRIVCEPVADLDKDTIEAMRKLSQQYQSAFAQVNVHDEAVSSGEV